MENTVAIFAVATVFALLVARQASKLGWRPWTWGFAALVFSPLVVWIILEIVGEKVEELDADTLELPSFEN